MPANTMNLSVVNDLINRNKISLREKCRVVIADVGFHEPHDSPLWLDTRSRRLAEDFDKRVKGLTDLLTDIPQVACLLT